MSLNSKDKGKRAERALSKELTMAGFEAWRGRQTKGGHDSPDVVCPSLPFHWECKWQEKLNIRNAMDQALKDADGRKWSVVAHRTNNKPWLVTMKMDEFLEFLLKNKSDFKNKKQPSVQIIG